ncbi:hypothetical protein WMY93_015996 [Mugilogobius chulae]|uniref:ATP-dependent DNA helicase n=1 Tax=Mugilogobius chulae TaxID=88201 RepID=A0AAW0NRS0_9GOBI
MVIALAALAEHKVSCVCSWDQWQLDRVLYVGDAVYTELRDLELTRGRESLLLTDLPNESVVGGQQFSFAYSEPLAGAVNVVEHEFIRDEVWVTFDSALEQLLAQYDTCLLTLCGNTVAVIKHNGRFAVVDSHARSASGMVHPNADGVRRLQCEEPAEVSSSVPQNTTLTGLKRKQSTSRRQRGLKRKKAAGVTPSVPQMLVQGFKAQTVHRSFFSVPPMQDSDVDLDVVVTGMDTGADVIVEGMDTGADVIVEGMDTGADVIVEGMETGADVIVEGEETLENLLQFDNGYRFMQPIRGTPPFWQSAQKDLFAFIRQLGIPTWFCSFSSADLRWSSLLKTLLKQEGSTRRVEELDWAERCDLLRRHPVTAARMFDRRWRTFFRKVIMSPAQPIGKEAVYRVLGMHLKEFSRKVSFVPTGDNIVRVSRPIGEIDDEMGEDIWMTNTIDRYLARPDDSVFNDMCIATFVSEYRLLSQSEKCKNPIMLQNGLGAIIKRTRTKPAVVRYARFSETKNTELFHQSIIQLFLPYRVETDLKPPPHKTFEGFYKNGEVRFSDETIHSVKSIVSGNRRRFEVAAADLEEVHEQMDCEDILEDAWGMLCPEQEVERLESKEEYSEMLQEVSAEQDEEVIPDLAVRNEVCRVEKSIVMSRQEGLSLVKTLNEQQLSIFYKIRQWCLEKVAGNNPEPLHVFITGGAGTGKSHLIRAIQYEASRLLAPTCHSPDNISVLLTAPTGIAAYNLQAATIHSTFSIGTSVSLPYTPLGRKSLTHCVLST